MKSGAPKFVTPPSKNGRSRANAALDLSLSVPTPPPQKSTVWLFDLDNTLYPASSHLMQAISERIDQFIQRHLNLPQSLAEAVREAYYGRYGSSIGGLMRHCQIDTAELLDFVHGLPVERYLAPDPALANLLRELPGRKCVFTNSPADYAWRVLSALGIKHHFDHVFDIYFAELEGKPSPAVYEKVLAALDRPAKECWFVDDLPDNLLPAKAIGCRTVWLTAENRTPPAYVEYAVFHLSELRDIVSQAKTSQSGMRTSRTKTTP